MHTTNQGAELFAKETLYELMNITRTGSHRFIVRGLNIATNDESMFIVDCSGETITKIENGN
jgi:hypothetical protein